MSSEKTIYDMPGCLALWRVWPVFGCPFGGIAMGFMKMNPRNGHPHGDQASTYSWA